VTPDMFRKNNYQYVEYNSFGLPVCICTWISICVENKEGNMKIQWQYTAAEASPNWAGCKKEKTFMI